MKLQTAESIAGTLIEQLAPACEKIEIAGSVRRKKPEVHDLEIVCVPVYEHEAGLFGAIDIPDQPTPLYALKLEHTLSRLRREGVLEGDKALPRNGAKYKRFIVREYGAPTIALDLFIAEAGNWGNIYCIRTGDGDWSRMLVTPRRRGGLMPATLSQHDGYLWRGAERFDCPEEKDFFTALGVPWVEPEYRNLSTARRLAHTVHDQLIGPVVKGRQS